MHFEIANRSRSRHTRHSVEEISGIRPRAFSLVEALVATAIIAILIAILLPAVQSARESARRIACVNKCKQIGLAMHNYHDTNLTFPAGRIWGDGVLGCGFNVFQCQDTSWFVLMLPQFEQQPLANAFNYSLGVGGPFAPPDFPLPVGLFANRTVMAVRLDLFQCPSDHPMSFQITPTYVNGLLSGPQASKGNYVVNWGNTQWDQSDLAIDGETIPFRKAPFGQMSTVSIAAFKDGTAATALLSEILQGNTYDIRGTLWQSAAGSSHYMSRFTPNALSDIYDHSIQGDAVNQIIFCVDEPSRSLPCVGGVGDRKAFAGVRSHHPGGVNLLYADGSVRFAKDSIAAQTWLDLHSIAGGEVINSDTY